MILGDDRRAREIAIARERAARAELAASLQFVVIVLTVLLATISIEYINHLSMLIKNCHLYRTSDLFDQLRNRTNFVIG